MTSRLPLFCMLLLLVTTLGCGSGRVSLRGTVTFLDDGSPLTTGMVFFDNGKEVARGKINEDGSYVLGSTQSQNDGIAPGTYKVYVQAMGADPTGVVDETGLLPSVSLVDSKFTSQQTSGLECIVNRSTKSYDIVVERTTYLNRYKNRK